MEIILFRHERVAMAWEKKYSSTSFDLACEKYDSCPIIENPSKSVDAACDRAVYVSGLRRSRETAAKLFGNGQFIQTPLLNEVPLKSFCDTQKQYPLWVWNVIGRLQWLLGSGRQPEKRVETMLRAKQTVALLEESGEDCYVITHGFYLRTLIRELKRRGFLIKKSRKVRIGNLECIAAVKEGRK